MNERRLAWIEIAHPFVVEMLMGDLRGFSDCPPDIRIVEARFDHERGTLRLLCRSESFDIVPEFSVAITRSLTFSSRRGSLPPSGLKIPMPRLGPR